MDGYTKRSFNSVIALTLHDHEVSQGNPSIAYFKQSYKQFLTSLIMTRFWGENRTHNLACQLDTFSPLQRGFYAFLWAMASLNTLRNSNQQEKFYEKNVFNDE